MNWISLVLAGDISISEVIKDMVSLLTREAYENKAEKNFFEFPFVLPELVLVVLCFSIGVRGGGGGGRGAAAPPPQFSQKYQLVGQFLLKSRAIFLFRFCSLIFLIFSFHSSLALCIKTHSKTQEKALKRLCFSKFSGGLHASGAL